MAHDENRSLTFDLAWVIVAEVAPEESAVFPVLSEAYFAPAAKRREDEELGFGGADVVSLLTPVVMAAVDAVTQELVTDLLHEKAVHGINEARAAVRRLFRLEQRESSDKTKGPDEPPVRLTTAQWAEIHRLTMKTVRHEGGTQEAAERIANALTALGQGISGPEQP